MSAAGKRLFDIILSLAALIVLAPVLAAIIVAVALTMGRPVFFTQDRIGRDWRTFRMYKFRTMRTVSGSRRCDGQAIDLALDYQRITRVGGFLRRWSLDELPQLFNVLLGDMSIVGPRPQVPAFLNDCEGERRRRHEVRPGITGWSQVNGRNTLTFGQKYDLDVWYVDNRSPLLDLQILMRTFTVVLRSDGIAHPTAIIESHRPTATVSVDQAARSAPAARLS